MLNNVPIQINQAARQVVLRHPNAMDCSVWRKTVNRVADAPPLAMGGLPTIGGLGVLDAEDEADYSYTELGDARIVFCGVFQGQAGNTIDADTGLNYADIPIEALVECVAEPAAGGYFQADKPDVVTVYPGAGIVLSYEVIGVTGAVNIPPYTRKLVLAPRQDMDVGI